MMEHDGRKDTETNHNSANYRKSRWGGRLSLTARLVILSRANAVDGTVIAAIVTTDDVTATIITTII